MKKTLTAVIVLAILAVMIWVSVRDRKPRGTKVDTQAAEARTVSSRVKATGEITPEKKVEQKTFLIWKDGEVDDFELKAHWRITTESGNSFTAMPKASKGIAVTMPEPISNES